MADPYDVKFIERFIRQEATRRGIDPDIAVRVARSEGLARNTWQSNLNLRGGREQSYGPFQLFQGGGLGDKYEKVTGHQVEDPAFVQDQVKFALDEARSGGWTPWHGWKGDRWAGITGGGGPLRHVGGAGSGAANFSPGDTYDAGVAGEGEGAVDNGIVPDALAGVLGGELKGDDKNKSLGGLLAEMGKPAEMGAPPNVLPQGGGSNVQSLPEYIQQFMAMRMRGGQPGGGMGGQGIG